MECCCCHTDYNHKHIEKEFSVGAFVDEYWKPLVSLVMLISGISLSLLEIEFFRYKYFSLIWYITAYLPVGIPILRESWEHICKKDFFNEFTLMSMAAIGAFYIGDYPEAVSVMLFYSIGEILQERAVFKARRHINSLLDVRPKTVNVIKQDGLHIEHPSKVQIGDVIEIKAGERVPLDGTMLGEVATFNTAALTGESIPYIINYREEVLSGMIPSDKTIRIEVTKAYDKSTLAHILDLIQNAVERKAPTETFIARFARIYTPVVFGIAVLLVLIPFIWSFIYPEFTFVFNDWLYRALVFLVISCPCALIISIPLGYFGGIGAASRQGLLFKGSNYLDVISKVNTIVFDKTGTLTKGVFEIQSISSGTSLSEKELIKLIASIERSSTHPIAKAIIRYAEEKKIVFEPIDNITEIAGHGLKALMNGKEILVGNIRLLSDNKVEYPVGLNEITDTLVVCAVERIYAGYISLSDTLKEDATEAIRSLKTLNIRNIQVLSGDKQQIVTIFANRLGIDKAYGNLLPEGKVEHINQIKQNADNRVAFVGDGMNDAPVLALSDVGIAMGNLGSDMAIETADIIIQTDQPSKVATAIRISRYTRQIVWQNIIMAMSVKLLVMALGAFSLATLWEAVFADAGVALLAVLNATRIGNLVNKDEK